VKEQAVANKRKSLIIDKPLQYRIISLVVGSGAVICLISIFGLYLLSRRIVTALSEIEPSSEATIQVLTHFNALTVAFIILSMVAIAWAYVSALVLSNRIAGPIYNISKVLDGYAQGDKVRRITLRRNDFFQPLAEKINRALDDKR
jgi:methyl-accepting chemotaxis protein